MEKLLPLKLKRHGTFSIREGWIEKGINYINADNRCFSKEKGAGIFGIGSNMVSSLRYWLTASRVAEFNATGAQLTELGNLLIQYDPYIEDLFSLWFIHINLSINKIDAPVFNAIANLRYTQFDKKFLLSVLPDELRNNGFEPVKSISLLESDVNVYLKSYYGDDIGNPENNLNCPLAKLRLLTLGDGNMYFKKNPDLSNLDFRVVYYSVLKWAELKNNLKNQYSFNIEDMFNDVDTPLNILNLSKSSFYYYLDEMKRSGYISLSKTAGLNVVYIDKCVSLEELFRSYFNKN